MWSICAKFHRREISLRKLMVCVDLREILPSFLRESSRLIIFVHVVNVKEGLFSWADLYMFCLCSVYILTVYANYQSLQ